MSNAEHALIRFDMVLPSRYPDEPPKMYFRFPNPVAAEINPNIHPTGLVCLSLLGTWHQGDATAKWQPGRSTILQVLVSIQAMVFTSDALHNEPMLEGHLTSGDVLRYEQHVQCCVVRGAMIQYLTDKRLNEGVWKDLIKLHFLLRGNGILSTVRTLAKKNSMLRQWAGRLDYRVGSARYLNARPENLIDSLEAALARFDPRGEDPQLARALIASLSVQ